MTEHELEQDEYTEATKLSQQLVSIVQELFLCDDIDSEINTIPELEHWSNDCYDPQIKRKVFIHAIVDSTLRDLWLDADNKQEYLGYTSCIDYGPTNIKLREKTINILSRLSSEEEQVLNMRYGIGVKEHTLEEVAEIMNIEFKQIDKIVSTALRKIGNMVG